MDTPMEEPYWKLECFMHFLRQLSKRYNYLFFRVISLLHSVPIPRRQRVAVPICVVILKTHKGHLRIKKITLSSQLLLYETVFWA